MDITREQVAGAINAVTGNPSSGIVHDLQPAIIDAVMDLLDPPAEAKTTRVLEVDETR